MKKTVYLLYPQVLGKIAPEIYGHFSEHIGGVFYDGLYVGEDSPVENVHGFRKKLVEKFKKINPPVLRWPGGCFAEIYNWRDGIGKDRPVRRNWWTPYDGKLEDNRVGTHEFMQLCELLGTKAYFAANMTALTPQQIREWMDYCLSPEGSTTLAEERAANGHPAPFRVPYWGVGNENWGGGGNMRPEYYADEFRRYSTLLHNAAPDVELFACGSNAADWTWTQGVMPGLAASERHVNGFAMHYYCDTAGDPVTFTEEEWNWQLVQAQKMEDILLRNWHIICGYGMQEKCKLVIDEWGCWHKDGTGPSKGGNLFEQQSSMHDAMVTALTLNIFNRHCDKIKMANVAQLVNNLHCLFLAAGENCITTPTYHVFDLYKAHQGATGFATVVTGNEEFASSLTVSASYKDGKTTVTVGNLSYGEDAEFCLAAAGQSLPTSGTVTLLSHRDLRAHNTFTSPEEVKPVTMDFDPTKSFVLPKGSIAAFTF